ncbi:hypothetical protein [Escherichia coli]|uniref:hypothetical protein n=2 Tax=Escherichia coli TaxID=562 RepID=UPI0007A56A32|nr:hypothetical protein [Escherichia coli]
MMSLWDALRMNMMISYQELVRTFLKQFSFIDRIRIYSLHPCLNKHLSIQSNRDWLSMSIFSDYSSSSEMHNNLTIDYYLALSSTKGSGITNIISIILQQAQDYDVAKIT